MKRTVILLIGTLLIHFGHSQSSADQVQKALDEFMTADNPMHALSILQAVEGEISKVPNSIAATYYVNVAICFGQMGKSDSSFLFLDKAEELATAAGSDLVAVKINNTRGLVYMGMADYEASLQAYQQAIDIAEGKNDPKMKESVRKIYGNVGGIYYQLGDLNKAKELTSKALTLSTELADAGGMAYNHLRLALVYNDMDSLTKGIFHLDSAVEFFEELGDTTTLVYAQNTMGRVFEKKGDFNKALGAYRQANTLAKSIGNQEEVAFTQLSIAAIYLKMGQPSSAQSAAREALRFAQENNYPNSQKRALGLLSKSAEALNNYQVALDLRNEEISLSDSLNGVEVKERVAEIETKYETEKKEAEIERLSLENALQTANLARSRNLQLAIGIGAGMTILLLVIFYTLRNKKLRLEREAQELQMEALKKRFMELHSSPTELAVSLEFKDLNNKLNTALTEREFETLKLSIEGKSNSEISDQLFISLSTVKFHLRNTYSKMGVGNRKEAFQYMLKTS